MNRLRGWTRTLAPRDLLSLPVFLGVLIEFVIVQFVSPYNVDASIALTALLQALAVVVAFAFFLLAYATLRHALSESALRVALLTLIPVGAIIGGIAMAWTRYITGLDAMSMWPLRVGATLMHVTAVTVLLWFAVSGTRRHFERLEALTRERDRLEALDLQATRSLDELDSKASREVRVRLLEGLARVHPDNPAQALDALTSTIEETVRPLSRQLEAQSEAWNPPDSRPSPQRRIDWRAAAAEGMAPEYFSPLGMIVILNLIALPMNLGRSGPEFAVKFILLSAVLVLPIFVLMRATTERISRSLARGSRAAAFVGMCLLSGLALGAVMLVITAGAPKPGRFLYLGPIFTLIIAFVWGMAGAAQRQAREAEASLQIATAELEWRIARSRELHRQRRRALAHALHGRVQAALASGILELDAAIRAGTATDSLVLEVRERIVECVNELDLDAFRPSSVEVVANKVRATWKGVLNLSITLEQEVESALREDPQCLMSLNDLIPELAFNSIKHGSASRLSVTIEQADRRTLLLLARDDGNALDATAGTGLGTRLFDACAISWSRAREGSCTLTTLLLPISRQRADVPRASGPLDG